MGGTAEIRRREIAARAARLFRENGYYTTSMRDIAEAAGIAKATLYHYYSKKDLILFTIHQQYAGELIERHNKRLNKNPEISPDIALKHVISDILDTVESRGDLMRVFFQHYGELPDDLRAAARKERDTYFAIVCELITDGQRRGLLRPIDPKIATFALFGMCNWSHQWYRSTGRWSPDDVAEAFWSIYDSGLVADRAPADPDSNGQEE